MGSADPSSTWCNAVQHELGSTFDLGSGEPRSWTTLVQCALSDPDHTTSIFVNYLKHYPFQSTKTPYSALGAVLAPINHANVFRSYSLTYKLHSSKGKQRWSIRRVMRGSTSKRRDYSACTSSAHSRSHARLEHGTLDIALSM